MFLDNPFPTGQVPSHQTIDRLLLACGFAASVASRFVALVAPSRTIGLLTQEAADQAYQAKLYCRTDSSSISGDERSKLYSEPAIVSDLHSLISWLQGGRFDAAIILTQPNQSPYALAYLCYLAGIPVRVGQSIEFGGSVLSKQIDLPLELVDLNDRCLHLLSASELIT